MEIFRKIVHPTLRLKTENTFKDAFGVKLSNWAVYPSFYT